MVDRIVAQERELEIVGRGLLLMVRGRAENVLNVPELRQVWDDRPSRTSWCVGKDGGVVDRADAVVLVDDLGKKRGGRKHALGSIEYLG